ncbi:MAG: EAL domain-containing protein [Methylobacter sp.]
MIAVQLELAGEMRELAAHMAASGWSRLRAVRLKLLASQVVKECQHIKWVEAAGRAEALSDLLSEFIQDAPSEARLISLLRVITRLADQLEAGQLASKIDVHMLPVRPEDWVFVLMAAASDELGDLAQSLSSLGFEVRRAANVDAAADAWRKGRVIVLAAASWLDGNADQVTALLPVVLKSFPFSSLLVALDDTNDFRTQIKMRQIGARLLLDLSPDVAYLIQELAGLAWMPRVPYRVMLVDDNAAARETHVDLLRETGFDVLAVEDPVTMRDVLVKFDPEVCVLNVEMKACQGTDLASLLHRDIRYARLPMIYLSEFGDIEHQLNVRLAGGEDYLTKPVDTSLLVTSVMAKTRQFRIFQAASSQSRRAMRQRDSLKKALDAHAIVTVAAPDGAIIDVNQNFCEISGYSSEEVRGRNHRIVKSGYHSGAFFEEMWRTITVGRIWQGEIQNRSKNGAPYWVQSTIVPILDELGIPEQYISIRTDVTGQKRLQAEQERRGRLLDLLRQAFEHFITSHDIAATSELLLDGMLLLTGSTCGFIGEVEQGRDGALHFKVHAASCDQTSRQLRGELGKQSGQVGNLNELIDNVLRTGETVIVNGLLHDPSHAVMPQGYPPLNSFLGVPMRQGETLVGMAGLANRQDGYDAAMADFLQTFTASYVGILEAARLRNIQQQIIDELQQTRDAADRANNAKSKFLASWGHELRTPLNAILCHAQILGMNDALDADTRQQVDEIVNAGAQFARLIGELLEQVDDNAVPSATPVSVPAGHKGRRRILVAEDNPANQAVLRMQLDALGYEADIAGDGSTALGKWKAGGHDLVLIDRNMPGMNGLELARAIRASEKESGANVPMIAITAIHHSDELEACRQAGMNDVLPKPIELDDLRRMLDRWLPHASAVSVRDDADNAPLTEANAILDTDYLARVVGTKEVKPCWEIIDLFTSTARGELSACRTHLDAGDGRRLADSMHKIKSSARMVGAFRFASIAETLEHDAKEGRLQTVTMLLAELGYALRDVEELALNRFSSAQLPAVDHCVPICDCLPKHVLVVDDDLMARRQVGILLTSLGVGHVLSVDGGKAAMAEVLRSSNGIDLIITDLNMPGMDGIEFLRRLAEANYRQCLIIYSGVEEKLLQTAADLAKAKGLQLRGTIKKPMTQDVLAELLKASCEKPISPTQPAAISVSASDILDGIRHDEFSMHFQPKVDAVTLRVIGVEALARWQHNGQWISPGHFIDLAEQCGLIGSLSEVLLAKAIIGGARISEAGFPLTVAVNLSMGWLSDINLPEFIMANIQTTGFKVENLTLEITESGVMTDVAASLDVTSRLRLKGFKLSIDDFGTGYSSMDQLQRFPFSELKLDYSFVHGAATIPAKRAILASSIEMAKKLNLLIVAEGVETQADLDLVRGLGCDQVQGWYVAKAMPVKELIPWLQSRLALQGAGA